MDDILPLPEVMNKCNVEIIAQPAVLVPERPNYFPSNIGYVIDEGSVPFCSLSQPGAPYNRNRTIKGVIPTTI
jgi:hypothetical protein